MPKVEEDLKNISPETDIHTISVFTNGCSEAVKYCTVLKRFFYRNGLSISADLEKADVIIFYACGLTEKRQNNSINIIQGLNHDKSNNRRLIIWGCLPKIEQELIQDLGQKPIIGPLDIDYFERFPLRNKKSIEKIEKSFSSRLLWEDRLLSKKRINENLFCRSIRVDNFLNSKLLALARMLLLNNSLNKSLTSLLQSSCKNAKLEKYINRIIRSESKTLYIPIATGCENNCTFCAEKLVFGKTRSRLAKNILDEFEIGLKKGFKNFSLIATDLAAYGKDIGCNLPDLIKEIINAGSNGKFGLYLNQVEPNGLFSFFKEFEEILSFGKIIGLNCPAQSGSNRILKLMGRKYTAEEWREKMILIQKKFKKIRLTTHILVGFPSESDEDYEKTLSLFNYPLTLHGIRVFKYHNHQHVAASNLPDKVPAEIKEYRCQKLRRKYAKSFIKNVFI